MKANKLVSLGGLTVLLGLVTVSGCNGMKPGGGAGDDENGVTSSVKMAITGGDFSNNSVLIIADRNGEADSKYPCVSHAKACFNFDAQGNAVPSKYDEEAADDFMHLCPSVDVNVAGQENKNGHWTFKYKIVNDKDCKGEEITGENFDCYAPEDLFSQDHPNKTFDEFLPPGPVENEVLCLSANTQKTFDFTACEILDPPAGAELALDCGCTGTVASPDCPFDVDQLPDECELVPSPYWSGALDIVCAPAASPYP